MPRHKPSKVESGGRPGRRSKKRGRTPVKPPRIKIKPGKKVKKEKRETSPIRSKILAVKFR